MDGLSNGRASSFSRRRFCPPTRNNVASACNFGPAAIYRTDVTSLIKIKRVRRVSRIVRDSIRCFRMCDGALNTTSERRRRERTYRAYRRAKKCASTFRQVFRRVSGESVKIGQHWARGSVYRRVLASSVWCRYMFNVQTGGF